MQRGPKRLDAALGSSRRLEGIVEDLEGGHRPVVVEDKSKLDLCDIGITVCNF
jgi:hypothetical protein